jgi:hypothetical protein
MAIIVKPNTFTNGETLDAAKFNEDFDTLYNEINGGLDSTNIDTNGVATTNIADNAVTPAKVDDSTTDIYTIKNLTVTVDAVLPATWKRIAIASPSGVDTYTFSGLLGDTDIEYKIFLHGIRSGTGNFAHKMQFNGDTANNYRFGYITVNSAGDVSGYSSAGADDNMAFSSTQAGIEYVSAEITVFALTGMDKRILFASGCGDKDGTALGSYLTGHGKWNSTAQITSITIFGAPATGNVFVAGSSIELWARR